MGGRSRRGDGLHPSTPCIKLHVEDGSVYVCACRPLLSSSYNGFGLVSLAQDAFELEKLLCFLKTEYGLTGGTVACGHSTGCQSWLTLLGQGGGARLGITALILQGGVSDRDYAVASCPDTPAFLLAAQELLASGHPEALMPRDASCAPVTASRYLSLCSRLGGDDFFSADLTSEEVSSRVGVVCCPVLVVCSGADEYVPAGVDQAVLGERLLAAMSPLVAPFTADMRRIVTIDGADHALSAPAHTAVFVAECEKFLSVL